MIENLSTFVESGVCNTISTVHHHYLRDLSKSWLPSPCFRNPRKSQNWHIIRL
ncbi:hypothetical protein Hanom_Chr02g00115041 [Helianthus anomalus]